MEAHVNFTPDGGLISSAAPGGTRVWDARRGRILRRYPIGGRFELSPTARLAIALNSAFAGDPHFSVARARPPDRQPRNVVRQPAGRVVDGLAFNHDGTRITGGTDDGTHVWDATPADPRDVQRAPPEDPPRRRAGPPGTALLGTTTAASAVWDPDGGRRLGRRFRWGPIEAGARVPVRGDRPRGAVMATSQRLRDPALVDLRTKRPVRLLPARDGDFAGGRVHVRRPPARHRRGRPEGHDLGRGLGAVVDRLRYPVPCRAAADLTRRAALAIQLRSRAPPTFVDVRELRSGRHAVQPQAPLRLRRVGVQPDSRLLLPRAAATGVDRVLGRALRRRAVRESPALEPGRSRSRQTRGGCSPGPGTAPCSSMAGTPAALAARRPSRVRGHRPDRRIPGRTAACGARLDADATLWDMRTHERVGDHFAKSRGLIPRSPSSLTAGCSHRARPRDRVAARPPGAAALRLPGRRPRADPGGVARRAAQPALPAHLPVRRPGRRPRPPRAAPVGQPPQ